MAAAITQHMCVQHGIELKVRSAGTGAIADQPITAVAGEVLHRHGIVAEHQSQRLSKSLLLESDRVFLMEQRHGDAVNSLLEKTDKKLCPEIQFLDQANEIPDPLGKSRETYENLANLLFDLIYTSVLNGKDGSLNTSVDRSVPQLVDKT